MFTTIYLSVAGIFLFFLALVLGGFYLQRRKMAQLEPRKIPQLLEESPALVAANRLTYSAGKTQIPYVEYVAQLPDSLAGLSVSDSRARELRPTLSPPKTIEVGGPPTTGDPIFDGLFELVPGCDEAQLNNPNVRQQLQMLSEVFDGVWVDFGKIRVVEQGHMDSINVSVASELLDGVVSMMNQ